MHEVWVGQVASIFNASLTQQTPLYTIYVHSTCSKKEGQISVPVSRRREKVRFFMNFSLNLHSRFCRSLKCLGFFLKYLLLFLSLLFAQLPYSRKIRSLYSLLLKFAQKKVAQVNLRCLFICSCQFLLFFIRSLSVRARSVRLMSMPPRV